MNKEHRCLVAKSVLWLLLLLASGGPCSAKSSDDREATRCPNTTLGVVPRLIVPLKFDTLMKGPKLIKLYDVKNQITPWSVSVDTEGHSSLLCDSKVRTVVNVKELEKSFGKMQNFKRTYFVCVANQTICYFVFVLHGDGTLEKFSVTTDDGSTGWSTLVEKER